MIVTYHNSGATLGPWLPTMIDIGTLKVYSPGNQAREWGLGWDQIVDLATAMQQPFRVAVLPVYYNRKTEFSYLPQYDDIDIRQFDLVCWTDIEFRSQHELIDWIEQQGGSQWLLMVAGIQHHEPLRERVIYRPAWAMNFLEWNQDRSDFPMARPFLFDCLCGTRRQHRDYVMLSMLDSGLLERSIVTYRDVFVGGDCTHTPDYVQAQFPHLEVPWPYVSPNLDPSWEVPGKIDRSISGLVPWEIYNRTWFSILVETLGYGETFLAAEKVGKCLHARRLFVHFGAAYYLENLRSLGFETFDSVLDESYDRMFKDNVRRWRMAFDQVKWLSQQDPAKLLTKVKPILDHNHDRLQRLVKAKRDEMHRLIAHYLNEVSQYR